MNILTIAALATILMPAAAADDATAAKEAAASLLYSVSASWREYQHAQETISRSAGNHEEIEADYQYFYDQLTKGNAASDKNREATLLQLKKSYAQKHKKRAAAELIKQRELAKKMEQRLNEHQQQFRALKSKYKNVIAAQPLPEVEALAAKLSISVSDLQTTLQNHTKNAARYDEAYKKIKKGFV